MAGMDKAAVRRSVVIMGMMVIIMLVAAVESKDFCEEKCDKDCATNPFFSQCVRICLIECRNIPPTSHSDCSDKCAIDCRHSLFHTVCFQNCLKKCKPPSFSGRILDCTDSRCTNLASGDHKQVGSVDSCSKKLSP